MSGILTHTVPLVAASESGKANTNAKAKKLRLSGDGIMRHNTNNKKAVMMKRWVKEGVRALTLGLMMSTSALAAPLSGKVFLDYDNTGSSQNAPLSGITVEVLDSGGSALPTPLTTTTGSDGSYSFDSTQIMTANTYKVKASTANNESIDADVTIPTSSGVSGHNLFLKGSGGDISIKVESTKPTTVLLKDMPVSFSSARFPLFSQASDSSGYVYLNNTLQGENYQIGTDLDDILANTSNGGKGYALWNVTRNSTEIFADTFSLTMNGTNQNGSLNLRERNDWGANGVVMVDQDDNGALGEGIDTPAQGFQLALYYQGTSTPVLGTSTQVSDVKGEYQFTNLPLGDYTVKILNVSVPWQLISGMTDTQNFTVGLTTGSPLAFNYLVKVSDSDTSLPGISGSVFVLNPTQKVVRGPDSGQTGNNYPQAGSTRFSIPVTLYEHNGSSWLKRSTVTSKADGSYAFKGLTSGKDYKVTIDDSSISNQYYFVGDTDGKSTTRSVTLTSGSETIKGKEIVLVGLTNKKSSQNFWYSNVQANYFFVRSYMSTLNGTSTWGGSINGVVSNSMTAYFTFSVFEEDGVTPATFSSGTALPATYTYRTLANPFAANSWTVVSTNHSGVYAIKVNTSEPTVSMATTLSYIGTNNLNGDSNGGVSFYANPINSHRVQGTIFYDKNGNNSRDTGDVDAYSAIVNLYKKRPGGTIGTVAHYEYVSRMGSNSSGLYNFTNLPDGDYFVHVSGFSTSSNLNSTDYVIAGNADGNTTDKVFFSLSGGGTTTGKDFWYTTNATEPVISGAVYLDTYLADGILQIEQSARSNDTPFYGVSVLLCETALESDCYIGSTAVKASQVTNTTGQFEFKSSAISGGIKLNTNYIVKAVKNDSVAITQGSLAAFYPAQFSANNDAPMKMLFLMKGNAGGRYQGKIVDDMNGDAVFAGNGTSENGSGGSVVSYYDSVSDSYIPWVTVGYFWSDFDLRSLPEGKYRITHTTPTGSYEVADSDPDSVPGTVDFEIASNGSVVDGKGNTNRHFYLARQYSGVTEGVSGQIYLDIAGSGIKDNSSVLLPTAEFTGSGIAVDGYYSPRFYTNYTVGESTVLNSPNFTDNNVETTNYFAHKASNSVMPNDGTLYITNYLLHLKNLPAKYKIVANSGQTKGNYFSSTIKNDLSYMQVTPTTTGAANQYYLLQMVTPTTLSGHLYYDSNNNGSFDPTDETISGVRVNLYQAGTTNLISYVVSDADGKYQFNNLFDGNYDVEVTTTGLNTAKYELLSLSKAANITISAINPNVSDMDFVYNKIGDASISGYVMLDINNNGLIDIDYNKQGDLALSGITVELYENSLSSTPKTIITNAKGYYNFPKLNLDTGYYIKVITASTGYGVVSNTNSIGSKTSDTLDKISIGSTPQSITNQSFLFAGESNSNPGAGIGGTTAKNSGIAGFTYEEGTTTPISASIMISLYDSSNTEIARQMTSGSGEYHFYNLPNDTYRVMVTSTASGFALSSNAAGTTPFDTISGLVLSGTGVSGKHFYYKESSIVGITGNVYVDFANNNTSMTLDSNDYPLENVEIELYEGLNATGSAVRTVKTLTNGSYAFPNLLYGVDYSVKIKLSSIPDYDFKRSKAGAAATDITLNIATLAKAGSTDNHYLVKGKQKITGDVWIDVNGDLTKGATGELLNGVTVKLEYKAPGASAYSTLKTTTTANASSLDGQYSFTALPKGTDYKVIVDGTSSVLAGTSLIPSTGTGSIAGNTDTFETTALSADVIGQSTAYNYNGKVSGQFIVDIDGNGAKSAVDSDFAGVELELKATINGIMITKTATTGTDGKFSIDNLPIGNWSLNVAAAASQTVTNWSSYTLSYSKNSAGTKVTGSSALPLTMAITAIDTTFANIEVAYNGGAKISGYVVLDVDPTDGTHAVTAIDTPVTGLTMTLSSDTAGFVSRTVTTDSNGYYEFTGLGIHTYKVSVDSTNAQLAGHLISFDPLSTATSTSSSSSVNLAVSAANSDLTTQDFGYKSSGGLSGYIYRDISGSGTRHSAVDDKLAGVKIKATQGSVVRYSNLTTANGEYTIENLAAGPWTVEIDTLPSSDYLFSYIADTFGTTATVVTNGAEVDILPTAATRAVKGATVSFGVKANALISGKVVIDVDDQNPLPPAAADVMAEDIAIDASGFFPSYVVSLYNGSTLLRTATVVGGDYAFTNLADNVAYTVEVTQPSSDYINSFTLTSSSTGVTAGTVTNTAAKMSQTYRLAATNTQAQNSHFAWKGAGGVSGNVFWDKNDDGEYTNTIDSDVGAVVTVTLSHASGSVPNITRTIASGSTAYSATGLLPGSWTIATFGVPTTFKASFDPDDAYSASSLAATANSAVIKVGGSTLTNQHFGYIKGGAMVGELKNDASASGSYNSGDAGLNPVEVSLLDTSNRAILDTGGNPITVNTNSHGEFSFRNLDPTMDYHVQVLFGSAALGVSPTHLLGEMEPSYDSQAGRISLIPPVSSSVDVVNETHTILAAITAAANNEITVGHLYFGYRSAGGDLTIHKKALKDNVVTGDIVPYTITIENNKATTAFNVMIKDLIPAGFKYVSGSARLDGKKISNPSGNRPLFFGPIDIGGQGAGSAIPTKRTLTYMLVVGAGVTQGEYKNVAIAVDRTGKEASNTSEATVTVTSDPLFDNALIFGKVYVDRNGNGIQDEGEEGLAGVKLVTVRGEIITTDAFGRYHLAGVNGGRWERGTNFVLKLDPKSLPKGYKVIGRNPIVVRLSPGLPSKIDFKISEDK